MFDTITVNPHMLGGKPYIKGTRLSVEFILELFAGGADRTQILAAYPQLTAVNLDETLRYALHAMRNEIVIAAEVSV